MIKQDLDLIKKKQEQIEYLKAYLHKIQTAKIKHIELRHFDEDSMIYQDTYLKDFPRRKIKKILIEDAQKRLDHAVESYEALFNGVSIVEDVEELTTDGE